VRELIYLSEAKLRQFQPDQHGWWQRVREFGVKGPFSSGEVRVALADETARRHPNLASVLKHIERSDRPSKWYAQQESLDAGDWVQFECRLVYKMIDEEDDLGFVLFWEPDAMAEGSTARLKKPLILHGSTRHLLLDAPPGDNADELLGSGGPSFMHALRGANLASETERYAAAPKFVRHSAFSERDMRETLRRFMNIPGGIENRMAAWMAGYARVTCDLDWVLLASPLYVEFVSAPDEEELGAREMQ
jgi:hypothetical protein